MGEKQTPHKYFYWEFQLNNKEFIQAVRMGDWKGVRKNPDKPLELYNLKDDLGERNDISKDYPAIVKVIEKILEYAHIPSKYWPVQSEVWYNNKE